MNTNGLHWKTSPAVAELEQVALGWLRQWLGLPPEFFGIIYDTASTSTMHALICAREFAQPESRVEGYRGNLVVYTSEQAHSSVEKGAMAVGIGQNYVRKVPTDSEFRMKPDALRTLIEDDLRAGLQPACIVATIGTTSSTIVDPVAECAAAGRRVRTSGCTSIAPTPARAPCCPSAPNTSGHRARPLRRHQSAQVADDPDGPQRLLHPQAGDPAPGACRWCPSTCAPPKTRAPCI